MSGYSDDWLRDVLVVPSDPRFYDPWRIYQDVGLLDAICDEFLDRVPGVSIDVLAGVSDLGFPLAIALAAHISDSSRGAPVPVLLTTDDVPPEGEWIRPWLDLSGKTVVLCDDLMAGGGHMRDSLRRLESMGAVCVAAFVVVDNGLVNVREGVDEVKLRLSDNLIALVSIPSP